MQDKLHAFFTGITGAITMQVSHVSLDYVAPDINIAALSQTIANILIACVTLYKLLKPNKKDAN
jgi:hypothetical protein